MKHAVSWVDGGPARRLDRRNRRCPYCTYQEIIVARDSTREAGNSEPG